MLILRKGDINVIYQQQVSWPLQNVVHVYAFCVNQMLMHFDSFSSEDTNDLAVGKYQTEGWEGTRNP